MRDILFIKRKRFQGEKMFNYQPEPDIPFPWNPDPDDDEEDD